MRHRARRAQLRRALEARALLGRPIRKRNGKCSLIGAIQEGLMLAAAGLSLSPRARARRERKNHRKGVLSVFFDRAHHHLPRRDASDGPPLTYESLLALKRHLEAGTVYQVRMQRCGSPVMPEQVLRILAAD